MRIVEQATMYGVSRRDWARAGEFSCMALWCAGLRPDNVVHISFPFTLFFGGWAHGLDVRASAGSTCPTANSGEL